jgi:hypothetical protein
MRVTRCHTSTSYQYCGIPPCLSSQQFVQHEFHRGAIFASFVSLNNLVSSDGSKYDAPAPAVLVWLVRSCRQRANVYDRGRQVYQGWKALPNSVRKVGLLARDYVHACTLLVSRKPQTSRAANSHARWLCILDRAVCGCCGVELAVCLVRCWKV